MSSQQSSSTRSQGSSEATRRRLLDAALEEFGGHGFDGVSTRQLAEKAKANLAAIPYHFGGKEGLYTAVVEELIATVQNSVGNAAARIDECLQEGPLTLEEGEVLITGLVKNVIGVLVGADRARFRAALVIRELMNPSAAFELLYDGYMRQVHLAISRLVASFLGEDPESEPSILRAHALLGQIIVFGAGRELIRRRADWTGFTADHLEQIAESVTETFVASIRGMQAQRGIESSPNPS